MMANILGALLRRYLLKCAVSDESGHSPFGNGYKSISFLSTFTKAHYLTGLGKGFIAELMPKYPIYIRLLSHEAQGLSNKCTLKLYQL